MNYFQINELIQWITPFLHEDLKIKNEKYWIEINGYYSKWSIKIELNGEIRLFKSEINEYNAYDELILKIIEILNDKKLILFWNDYDKCGYLLKSTHDYNGLMNALIQNDLLLKTEIRNLREYVDYLERKVYENGDVYKVDQIIVEQAKQMEDGVYPSFNNENEKLKNENDKLKKELQDIHDYNYYKDFNERHNIKD